MYVPTTTPKVASMLRRRSQMGYLYPSGDGQASVQAVPSVDK